MLRVVDTTTPRHLPAFRELGTGDLFRYPGGHNENVYIKTGPHAGMNLTTGIIYNFADSKAVAPLPYGTKITLEVTG